jgi:hypothetical protein
MKSKSLYLFYLLMLFGTFPSMAQLNVVIENGSIYIKEKSLGRLDEQKYNAISDSLEKMLKLNPKDTTRLFKRALVLEQLNNQLAKATSSSKDPISNLITAKELAEHAISFNMTDFKLKVLRAQIYKDLAYRYSVSDSWKLNDKQIAERKVKFNNYKNLANKCYDELAALDNGNAYDYQKLKLK